MRGSKSVLKTVAEAALMFRRTPIVDDDFPEARDRLDSALRDCQRLPPLPRVVCLCGSTRFYEQFQRSNFEETMAGNIVLSVGFYPHGDVAKTEHGEQLGITREQKEALDELHKRKIDLADEVLVLNVGGYVGESTRSEIGYAERTGKSVRYLEQHEDVR